MSTQTLPSPLTSPTFVELFTPKLVTVFREGYGFANFRADLMAGLTVAIVALPLSMAIAIGSHATPGAGSLHIDRRRLRGVALERQPLPDRRTRRRFHCAGGGDRTAARHGWPDPGDDPFGDHADGDRLSAARHLHQVHTLSGDGRFHRRHRSDHLLKRDQAAPGLVLQRRRARTAHRENSLPVGETPYALPRRAQPLAREHRGVGGLAPVAAALARHADRCRVGGARGRRAQAAGRDDRISVRRHSARPAATRAAAVSAGKGAGRAAQRDLVRAARRDRIAALRRRRRRHDRDGAIVPTANWSLKASPISRLACSAAYASPGP